jgi:hypothetical protein
MTTRIKTRHDTAANWLSVNPVLALGEAGVETDTRKVKYGDGLTSWMDLLYASEPNQFDYQWTDGVNDNTWHVVTVTGAKEFEYETPGHKYTIVANTATLVDSTTYDVDSIVYDMEYVDIAYANESAIWIYVNNDHGSRVRVNNITTGSTYTFTLADPISANPGDEVTIEAWYRGTQLVWDKYNYYQTINVATSVTATNTVVLDSTHYQRDPDWTYMWETSLPANVTNHSIVFNAWRGGGSDARAITAVTTASNGLVTITFDGAPRDVAAITLADTINTTPANSGENYNYVIFSKTQFPEFIDCVGQWELDDSDGTYTDDTGHPYYDDPRCGYVIIDGGSPIDFQFWGGTDANDNWVINLRNNTTWTSTSTLEIHWYRRGDGISLDVYDLTYDGLSDGYKWFDWRTDLPQAYRPESGNGVTSGRIMAHCQVYAPEVEYRDQQSYNLDFANSPQGSDYYYPYDAAQDSEADNITFFGNSTPFDRFGPNGISFVSYFGPDGTWTTSARLKVRIIYKMDLIVGNTSDLEFYC